MKKYLKIALAMMLALAMALGTSAVYADEDKPDFELYMPYMDMTENCYETSWSIYREYVVYTGAADGEEPLFLDEEACIEIDVTDADGNLIEPDDNEWILPEGVYTFTWTNVDEIIDRLYNEWEYADNYNILTPTDTQFTVTVTGAKNAVTFELYESSITMFEDELLNLYDYEFIWFCGYGGGDSYEFPDSLQRYAGNYEYELTDADGYVLTDEDFQQPLAAGVYTLSWSNVDEVKAAFEAEYDSWEYSYKYDIIFPDEPVTSTLEICYNGEESDEQEYEDVIPDDKPYFYWITAGVNLAGCDLMGADDFIWLTDLEQDESNPDYILDNVELEYYDAEGNLLDLDYFDNGMPEGEYTIVWVNYDEFWELNDSEGWGLDESYYVQIPIQDDYPTARLEIVSSGIEYTGSAFSNSTLTVILGGTVVICLAVIAVLAVKLKKQQ